MTALHIEYGLCALGPQSAWQRGSALAMGFFDGVHVGHQQVIAAAVDFAAQNAVEAAVFTFSLPAGHGMKGGRITTDRQKHKVIEALGVQHFFEPPFASFCELSPRQFVTQVLHGLYNAKAVFCGENFTFGKKAAGNVALLKQLCGELGIQVHIVPMALYGRQPVSSTRIRAALAAGELADAAAMLGRPYRIVFPVRHGQGLGRTLGMPTINQIYPAGFQLPKLGVYVSRVNIGGQWLPSVTGLGSRPTVNDDAANITCETFIPGFEGQVYGQQVLLEFCRYIEPSRKFESPAQLQKAVMGWAAAALRYFDAEKAPKAEKSLL